MPDVGLSQSASSNLNRYVNRPLIARRSRAGVLLVPLRLRSIYSRTVTGLALPSGWAFEKPVIREGALPNLDDPQTYVDLDPSGMAGRLSDVPRQCLQGWRQATSLEVLGLSGPFDHVVIVGMGGSAIAGDLVADLASLQGRLPVTVVREFEIPFSLNPQTLMIACSYSGNTQETLAMFRHGLEMGATAVAATAGGTLAREASERDVPTLFVDVEGEPRNAAVYNFTLLLGLLSRLGLLSTEASDVRSDSGRAYDADGGAFSGCSG